ncbi:MAG: hypothetical protein ABIA04_08190 [Pseudomonadota bacterium]
MDSIKILFYTYILNLFIISGSLYSYNFQTPTGIYGQSEEFKDRGGGPNYREIEINLFLGKSQKNSINFLIKRDLREGADKKITNIQQLVLTPKNSEYFTVSEKKLIKNIRLQEFNSKYPYVDDTRWKFEVSYTANENEQNTLFRGCKIDFLLGLKTIKGAQHIEVIGVYISGEHPELNISWFDLITLKELHIWEIQWLRDGVFQGIFSGQKFRLNTRGPQPAIRSEKLGSDNFRFFDDPLNRNNFIIIDILGNTKSTDDSLLFGVDLDSLSKENKYAKIYKLKRVEYESDNSSSKYKVKTDNNRKMEIYKNNAGIVTINELVEGSRGTSHEAWTEGFILNILGKEVIFISINKHQENYAIIDLQNDNKYYSLRINQEIYSQAFEEYVISYREINKQESNEFDLTDEEPTIEGSQNEESRAEELTNEDVDSNERQRTINPSEDSAINGESAGDSQSGDSASEDEATRKPLEYRIERFGENRLVLSIVDQNKNLDFDLALGLDSNDNIVWMESEGIARIWQDGFRPEENDVFVDPGKNTILVYQDPDGYRINLGEVLRNEDGYIIDAIVEIKKIEISDEVEKVYLLPRFREDILRTSLDTISLREGVDYFKFNDTFYVFEFNIDSVNRFGINLTIKMGELNGNNITISGNIFKNANGEYVIDKVYSYHDNKMVSGEQADAGISRNSELYWGEGDNEIIWRNLKIKLIFNEMGTYNFDMGVESVTFVDENILAQLIKIQTSKSLYEDLEGKITFPESSQINKIINAYNYPKPGKNYNLRFQGDLFINHYSNLSNSLKNELSQSEGVYAWEITFDLVLNEDGYLIPKSEKINDQDILTIRKLIFRRAVRNSEGIGIDIEHLVFENICAKVVKIGETQIDWEIQLPGGFAIQPIFRTINRVKHPVFGLGFSKDIHTIQNTHFGNLHKYYSPVISGSQYTRFRQLFDKFKVRQNLKAKKSASRMTLRRKDLPRTEYPEWLITGEEFKRALIASKMTDKTKEILISSIDSSPPIKLKIKWDNSSNNRYSVSKRVYLGDMILEFILGRVGYSYPGVKCLVNRDQNIEYEINIGFKGISIQLAENRNYGKDGIEIWRINKGISYDSYDVQEVLRPFQVNVPSSLRAYLNDVESEIVLSFWFDWLNWAVNKIPISVEVINVWARAHETHGEVFVRSLMQDLPNTVLLNEEFMKSVIPFLSNNRSFINKMENGLISRSLNMGSMDYYPQLYELSSINGIGELEQIMIISFFETVNFASVNERITYWRDLISLFRNAEPGNLRISIELISRYNFLEQLSVNQFLEIFQSLRRFIDDEGGAVNLFPDMRKKSERIHEAMFNSIIKVLEGKDIQDIRTEIRIECISDVTYVIDPILEAIEADFACGKFEQPFDTEFPKIEERIELLRDMKSRKLKASHETLGKSIVSGFKLSAVLIILTEALRGMDVSEESIAEFHAILGDGFILSMLAANPSSVFGLLPAIPGGILGYLGGEQVSKILGLNRETSARVAEYSAMVAGITSFSVGAHYITKSVLAPSLGALAVPALILAKSVGIKDPEKQMVKYVNPEFDLELLRQIYIERYANTEMLDLLNSLETGIFNYLQVKKKFVREYPDEFRSLLSDISEDTLVPDIYVLNRMINQNKFIPVIEEMGIYLVGIIEVWEANKLDDYCDAIVDTIPRPDNSQRELIRKVFGSELIKIKENLINMTVTE